MKSHVDALDGLRGVAVAAVVAYHVRPDWVPGGYLGVDLFFVLSGYLITSLLLEEYARDGRIDLPAFAGRRLRRLVPAVLVVVVASAVYVGWRGDLGQIEQVRRHGFATIGYVANWVFIADGDSYFAEIAAPSMLRHVWSLAIEEQFYLVWPVVTWGALRLAGRRSVAMLAAGIAVVSVVAMATFFDAADPSRVYFGTDTRIFEPLVGAALAVWRPLRAEKPAWSGPAAIGLGVAWVVTVLAVDDAWDGFYRGGALAIALAVAVVVVGASRPGPLARVLGWRPLVGLGAISYGVYLWHWPILVAARQEGWVGGWADAGIVVASVLVSVVSYRVVEMPVRRSTRLVGWRPVVVSLAAMVVAVGIVAVSTRTSIPAEAVTVADAIDRAAARSAAGDPAVVALIGDSSAWSFGGGLIAWGADHGSFAPPFDPARIQLVNLARKGYRLTPGTIVDLDRPRPRPAVDLENEAWWRETVAQVDPDLVVVMIGLGDLQSRVVDEERVEFGTPPFRALVRSAAASLLGDLAVSAPVVVFTSPPLLGEHMPQPVMAEFFERRSAARASVLNEILAGVAADDERITMLDFAARLCPDPTGVEGDNGCLSIDGAPARFDGVHFSTEGARLAATLVEDDLVALANGAEANAGS
ncbi:MAG: acyltransferase family protein [Actinomycetota bacterium]